MSYRHFTAVDRGKIEVMAKQGKSHQEIADEVGFHRTSVLRELRRNGDGQGYEGKNAQERYVKRRKACRKAAKLASDSPLRDYVADKIALEKWTPELVAGRLPLEFPSEEKMRVCHETI